MSDSFTGEMWKHPTTALGEGSYINTRFHTELAAPDAAIPAY